MRDDEGFDRFAAHNHCEEEQKSTPEDDWVERNARVTQFVHDVAVMSPWTRDQVDKLNAAQSTGRVHPFTCGRYTGHGALLATEWGWVCTVTGCSYRRSGHTVECWTNGCVSPLDFRRVMMNKPKKK